VVEDERTDGRLERSERSRAAVIDALLDLVDAGDLRPPAERIAKRAGVSLRTVFHLFSDKEEIFAAAAQRQAERVLATLRPVDAGLPLDERVRAFVVERARLHERVAPVRRAAQLLEPFSKTVAVRLAQARALKRADVERVFHEELASLRAPAREELVRALCAAASFSHWEQLRAHQGLTVEESRRVLTRVLFSLLATALGERASKAKR
jgi:AcrR family transcriptional regulator